VDHSLSWAVANLFKIAPIAKFKRALFLIIQILDIGTIFTKGKHQETERFKTENTF